MSSQKHIIYRQVLEVDVPSVEGAWTIQNRVSDHYKYNLLQVMSDIFDSISSPGEVLRIDKLELDLGDLKEQNLEGEITEKVKEKLTERLLQLKQKAEGKSGENLPEMVSLRKRPAQYTESDFLFHFLRTGTAPWWHNREQLGNAQSVFEKMILHSPQWVKSSFQKLLQERIVRKRIIGTFDDRLIQRLISLFDAQLAKETFRFLKLISEKQFALRAGEKQNEQIRSAALTDSQIQAVEIVRMEFLDAVMQSVLPSGISVLKKYFHQHQLLLRNDKNKAGLEQELKRFAIAVNAEIDLLTVENEVLADFEKTIRRKKKRVRLKRTRENLKRDVELTEVEETELVLSEDLIDDETETQSGENDSAGLDSIEAEQKKIQPEKKAKAKKSRKRKGDLESEPETDDSSFTENSSDEISNKKGNTEEELLTAETKKKEPDYLPMPEAEDLADFVIDNAGLVLVWPYLGAFFRELGLVSERKFVDEAAAGRAVHLLQYICDKGEFEYEEHDLVLNKILCGIEITEPIDMHFEITEREMDEIEGLLTGVRTNWNALGSTSNNGLRISFLRKEGSLKKNEQGWNLSIERTTIDMLLDRLPWSISIIRLPWSKDLLYVEW